MDILTTEDWEADWAVDEEELALSADDTDPDRTISIKLPQSKSTPSLHATLLSHQTTGAWWTAFPGWAVKAALSEEVTTGENETRGSCFFFCKEGQEVVVDAFI